MVHRLCPRALTLPPASAIVAGARTSTATRKDRPDAISASTASARFPRPSTSRSRPTPPARPSAPSSRRGSQGMAQVRTHIPLVIGGQEVKSGETGEGGDAARPRATSSPTGRRPAPSTSTQAIEAAAAARREWSRWPWEDRAAVFLKAAELLATTWRATVNAATMLGQSKTAFQAEIDSAAELVDFWRFNPHYAQQLYAEQPLSQLHDVEPARLPAARGLRLRGDALQLHLDRRQPAHGARAHGQHRRVEAGLLARSRAPSRS